MLLSVNLFQEIFFFNIGRYRHEDTYFNWSSSHNLKSAFFEIKLTRNAPLEKIFFCINKTDIKLVYYVINDVVFTIGANPEIQSLLLETILEYLIDQFFTLYDESLLMSCYGETCHIFNGFTQIIIDSFTNFKKLDLYETALVFCKACNKTMKIIIKKSLVENSTKPTVPIVFVHSGHALLCYIDKQYKVRGNQLVTLSL